MTIDISLFRNLAAAALIYIIARRVLTRFILSSKPSVVLPPGPSTLPVIGALPLLGSMPHVALSNMAKKYGPIMYLKVGTCGMVVASTPEAAKTFLKTLDSNFSDRPPNAGATHLAYGAQDMVFAESGPRWKLLRKLCNLHMLGGKALENWSSVRASEVGHMARAMLESSKRFVSKYTNLEKYLKNTKNTETDRENKHVFN